MIRKIKVYSTHKAQRVGRGCLGWSAAVRGQARTSGSAGSDSASGPCSTCFLSLWTQTGRHEVTSSKTIAVKTRLADMGTSQEQRKHGYIFLVKCQIASLTSTRYTSLFYNHSKAKR